GEEGPAHFGSYKRPSDVSAARATCRASASAAVTAVTGYSSSSPLFSGRPICAPRPRLGRLGHDQGPSLVVASPDSSNSTSAGRGAYAIRALPDLCSGIPSECLGHLDP